MANQWLEKTKSFLTAGPAPKFVALDLEGRKLRIVLGEPQRGLPDFRTLALVDAPETLDLKNAKAVGEFIGGALKQLNLPTTRVLMDVPRGQVVLKTLTLPPVEHEREMPAMVRYQVEKELPFPLDQAVIDFTVDNHYVTDANGMDESGILTSPPAPTTVDVLVAAVQHSLVVHYQKVAEAGGFKLHRLGLRPYADARCLDACLPEEDRKRSILLVHVLPGEVEVNLLIEGALAFSRSGAIRQHDDDGRPFGEKEILDGFVVEIARSAQGALSAHRGRKIDRVFLAGDTGQEQAIVEIVAQRFRTPCAVLDPAATLKLTAGDINVGGFISPLGLAIAHGTAERMPFDFLNPKNPPIERNIKKIRAVAGGIAASLLLVIGLTWGILNRNAAVSNLTALRDTYNKLEKQNRPIDKLGQRVKAVDEWKNDGHNWLDHWANISAKFPPATEAYITTLKTNPDGSFTFTVKAVASKVITDLSKSLREGGYDVKLGAETVQNDEFGYRYTTSVRLAVEPDAKIEPAKLKASPRPIDDGSAEILRKKGRYTPVSTPAPESTETQGTPAAVAEGEAVVEETAKAPVAESGDRTAEASRPTPEKSSDNREKADDRFKSSGSRSRDDRSRDRR